MINSPIPLPGKDYVLIQDDLCRRIVPMKKEVPVWKKVNLTIEEAAAYFGIGQNKLRELTDDPTCKFVIYIGTKRLIKRQLFEQYLERAYTL